MRRGIVSQLSALILVVEDNPHCAINDHPSLPDARSAEP
jgi:hypothetical protein